MTSPANGNAVLHTTGGDVTIAFTASKQLLPEGYVYENLVAQMLKSVGNELFYFTWPKDDKHNYEVDFLLSRENKIAPLEVKSDGYKAHASLDEFCKKFRTRISHRYIIYTKELRQEEAITCVPVYMTPLL